MGDLHGKSEESPGNNLGEGEPELEKMDGSFQSPASWARLSFPRGLRVPQMGQRILCVYPADGPGFPEIQRKICRGEAPSPCDRKWVALFHVEL
jgi:hypothetical protein